MRRRVAAFLLIAVIGWAYKAITPPPSKIRGSADGSLITSPRIKLRDGRHLAYKEVSTPKEKAKYKIIVVHGLDSSKDIRLPDRSINGRVFCMELPELHTTQFKDKARQQGVYESLHRDWMVLYGNWEFDPMNTSNPFPNGEAFVHIWQGYEDKLVPVELQRYVKDKLPWVQYHENPTGGHMFILIEEWSNAVLKALLLGQDPADP